MNNTLENAIVSPVMDVEFCAIKTPIRKGEDTDEKVKKIRVIGYNDNPEHAAFKKELLTKAELKKANPHSTIPGAFLITGSTNAYYTDDKGESHERFLDVLDEDLNKVDQDDIPNFSKDTKAKARLFFKPSTIKRGKRAGKTTAYLIGVQLLEVENAMTAEELAELKGPKAIDQLVDKIKAAESRQA